MKVKIKSKFLKAEDVKQGDVVMILDEGEEVESFGKTAYQFRIQLPDATTKLAKFGATTMKNLIPSFGDETEKWVGKGITANIVKVNNPTTGKIVDSIVFTSADDLNHS